MVGLGVTRASLPRNVGLKLSNSPSGASSFAWTVTAGSDKLVFSNGMSTITTATDTVVVKSLAASTAMKDVTVKVEVQGLSYAFKTDVRTPKQLKRRPDMDKDEGRGANCNVPGNQGYLSLVAYEVDDQFGVNTSSPDNGNAGINEKLGAKTDFQPNNWPKGTEGGSDTNGGLFSDQLCVTGGGSPTPKPPKIGHLSHELVDKIPQIWFAGDSTSPRLTTRVARCKRITSSATSITDAMRVSCRLRPRPPSLMGQPPPRATRQPILCPC